MRAKDVHIGETYVAKVSGKLADVRIDAVSPHGGWDGTNTDSGRSVRIRSPQRLRFNRTVSRLFRRDGDLRNLGRPVTDGDLKSLPLP